MLHQSEERERLVGSRTPYYLVPPDKEALPWDEDLEEDLGEGCGRIYKLATRRLRNWMDSVWWQIGILLLVAVDLGLLIAEAIVDDDTATTVIFSLTIGLLSIYISELSLRLLVFGVDFFRDWLNFVDSLIVGLSLFLTIALYDAVLYATIVRLSFRALRVLTGMIRAYRRFQIGARHLVGENKKRFTKDGFDLDLAYITSHVIVMSVPAIQFEGFYRNDLNEVARFFNTRHATHYKIFNCCAEREYPTDKFNDQVIRYHIEDHNVPPLALMLEFCQYASEWLRRDPFNIIAVHCRGGKGRSGTMICSYLLYSGVCQSAQQALTLFGVKRTDSSKGKKFQGVETMSQCRYVSYFEWVVKNNRELPEIVPSIALKRIYIEIDPSLEELAMEGNWRDSRKKGEPSKGFVRKVVNRVKAKKEGVENEDYDDEDDDGLGDTEEDEPDDDSVEKADAKEFGGVERKWKFFLTHTEGKRLSSPLAFYPDADELERDSSRIIFHFHHRNSVAEEDSPNILGNSVVVSGDTRIELRGMDEKTHKSRILLYFWFHTSFLEKSIDARDDEETPNETPLEGYGEVAHYSRQMRRRTKLDASSRYGTDLDGQFVEFLKGGVDRGRYKGCPFKKAHRVCVRLYYNGEEKV